MPTFDIKNYYEEQEERMNVPDETVDDFRKRVSSLRRGQELNSYASSSRMSQAHKSIKTDTPQPGIALSESAILPMPEAAPSFVRTASSEMFMNEHTMDSGRCLKGKTSVQDCEPAQEAVIKDKEISDQNNGMENYADLPQTALTTAANSAPISNKAGAARGYSPEIEEIDSFSVDVTSSKIPSKHKIPPEKEYQSPTKKRFTGKISCPNPRVDTADHSPISSFSRVITYSTKNPVNPRRDKLVSVPPLDMHPLREVPLTRPASKKKDPNYVHANDHDSTIEDASVTAASPARPKKKKRLEAEPTETFLEMKQLVSKKSASKKQHAKPVKLKLRPVLQEPTITTGAAHTIDESSIIDISSSPSSRASSRGPMEVAISSKQKQGVKEKVAKPPVEKRMVKGKKEKPQPVTPAEYARMLQANTDDDTPNIEESSNSRPPMPKRKKAAIQSLAGLKIFYIGGDLHFASAGTRGRMDIIVKYGGNLMPEYDPNVTTHIVTQAPEIPTLRALGLKSLLQIPEHIPVVKWDWVVDVMGKKPVMAQDEDELAHSATLLMMNAAFSKRIPQIPKTGNNFRRKLKGKGKAAEHTDGEGNTSTSDTVAQPNHLSELDVDMEHAPVTPAGAMFTPPTSPLRSIGTSKAQALGNSVANYRKDDQAPDIDPLAEFYAQARVERENEERSTGLGHIIEDSDSNRTDAELDSLNLNLPAHKQKKGFLCDTRQTEQRIQCPNQDIIDKLTELMELHKTKLGDEDHWRAFSYSKAIRALKSYPRRIKTFEEARGINGVGEKTAKKIEEILNTGQLQRIRYEKTEEVEVTRLFQGIYGVGKHISHQWYSAGCRTLDDLESEKGGVKLTPVQEIGLRFYDDINDRMPRAEAKAIYDLIKPIALGIDSKLFIEIMGSYRRGQADCGDLDILLTRPIDDGKTHEGIMPRLLKELHAADIITEDLAIPEDLGGLEGSYRGLCHFPNNPSSPRRRIDILFVPWACRGGALIYYTGDEIFNCAIRLKASTMGYTLDQRGLFEKVVRDPTNRRIKLNPGVAVGAETEEEIFKILDVPWQEPHERTRG